MSTPKNVNQARDDGSVGIRIDVARGMISFDRPCFLGQSNLVGPQKILRQANGHEIEYFLYRIRARETDVSDLAI